MKARLAVSCWRACRRSSTRTVGGHTGGNLLLSMMERYSGDFLAAVDGLRALLGCRGFVWPVSVEQATLCAE